MFLGSQKRAEKPEKMERVFRAVFGVFGIWWNPLFGECRKRDLGILARPENWPFFEFFAIFEFFRVFSVFPCFSVFFRVFSCFSVFFRFFRVFALFLVLPSFPFPSLPPFFSSCPKKDSKFEVTDLILEQK